MATQEEKLQTVEMLRKEIARLKEVQEKQKQQIKKEKRIIKILIIVSIVTLLVSIGVAGYGAWELSKAL